MTRWRASLRSMALLSMAVLVGSRVPLWSGDPSRIQAFVGATLVDGTGAGPLRDALLIVRGDVITCAGSPADCPVPRDAVVADVRGRWVIPGLIEAHAHFSQTGWVDGRPDAVDMRDRFPYERVIASLEAGPERFFRAYLCSGVTAVFDVGGYPWTWGLRRRVWYIFPPQPPDTPRIQALLRAASEEARARGLPLIVHATRLWEAKDAIRAGARVLVHSVFDDPVDEEFLRLAKENDVIYTPTITVIEGYRDVYLGTLDGSRYPLDCVDSRTRLFARPDAVPRDRVSERAVERARDGARGRDRDDRVGKEGGLRDSGWGPDRGLGQRSPRALRRPRRCCALPRKSPAVAATRAPRRCAAAPGCCRRCGRRRR